MKIKIKLLLTVIMKKVLFFALFAMMAIMPPSCMSMMDRLEGQDEEGTLTIDLNSNNSVAYENGQTMYDYVLTIGIKDASGNDLVATLKGDRWVPERETSPWRGQINPEDYKLEILLSNPNEAYDNSIYANRVSIVDGSPLFIRDSKDLEHLRPTFRLAQYGDDYRWLPYFDNKTLQYYDFDRQYYLLSTFSDGCGNGLQDHLTYRFSCPSIFGDDNEHEIVAYWAEEDVKYTSSEMQQFPKCIKVLFDEKEVTFANRTYMPKDFRVKEGMTDPERAMLPREYYAAFVDIVLDK